MRLLYLLLFLITFQAHAGIWMPKVKVGDKILFHKNYTLSYNVKTRQPDWVVYSVSRENLNYLKFRPDAEFVKDPLLPNSFSIPELSKSGYNPGQYCPSYLMSFSEESNDETFYQTNITPVSPHLSKNYNSLIIENIIKWVLKKKQLFILTGPVYYTHLQKVKIGENGIDVPNAFFYIILDFGILGIKSIAFIIPNGKNSGSIFDYTTTIFNIENLTGLNFFPELPNYISVELKSTINYQSWNL